MKNIFSHPFSEAGDHVNGWPVIQHFLFRNHVTQSSLAAHLQISPSAVSQIKQGMFLLNAEQSNPVPKNLSLYASNAEEMYSSEGVEIIFL